jgi:hypothetical protein
MARGRAEQVSSLKFATDSHAAEASQQASLARERRKDEERKLHEIQQTSPVRRWNQDAGNDYEKEAQSLVAMGFDRKSAVKALRANHGNINEAMDMLSEMPCTYVAPEASESEVSKQTFADKSRIEEDDDDDVEAEHEEDEIAKALAESQREEEERKQKQVLDDEALEAALAQSLQDNRDEWQYDAAAFEKAAQVRATEDEGDEQVDDEELRKALELSKKQEEDDRRTLQKEEEDFQKAIAENLRIYEHFHSSWEDSATAWADLLGQSESSGSSSSATGSSEMPQELELTYLYPDDDDGELLEDVPLAKDDAPSKSSLPGTMSSSSRSPFEPTPAASSSGLPGRSFAQDVAEVDDLSAPFYDAEEEEDGAVGDSRGFGKWFADKSPQPTVAQTTSASASSSSASAIGAVAGSSSAPSLDEWAFARMIELHVEIDNQMLWETMNLMENPSDEEEVKMWLGYSPDDAIPRSISTFLAEFKQRRIWLQTTGR